MGAAGEHGLNRAGRRALARQRRREAGRGAGQKALASGAVVALGVGLGFGGATPAGAGVSPCPVDGDTDLFLVENLDETGEGSLRCAVDQANVTAGANTVTFAAGVTGTIPLASALPINDHLDLQGPGADVVTVQGSAGNAVIVVSAAGSEASAVTISGLTLTHAGPDAGQGLTGQNTDLMLRDVVITGHETVDAGDGAGIHVQGLAYDTSLTVIDSTISGNFTSIDGGGIYAYDASVVLDNVDLVENGATKYGGGLSFVSSTGADLTITNSTITGNDAAVGAAKYGGGGGIRAIGLDGTSITVDGTTIDGNSASTFGGGITIRGEPAGGPVVTITNSTISGNTLANPDTKYDVLPNAFGGGLALSTIEPSLVAGTTISGNTVNAEQSAGGIAAGGGAWLEGPVTIENSTISGNTAGGGDTEFYDAAPGYGGGTYAAGDVVLRNTTVFGNGADSGGGLAAADAATLTNTIVAGNIAPTGPDVDGEANATWSLIGNTTDAGLVSPDTNVLDVAPQLGGLANNSGPTLTHLPLPGSPAINAGDPAFAPPPSTDQRSMPRVVEGRIDIGAVETGATGCPANPTPNQRFVCEVYIDALGREIDQGGFEFWVNALNNTPRTTVAFSVFGTPEYRQVVITSIFARLLDRAPDPAGLAFFDTQLKNGAPIEQIEASVAASTEYFDRSGATNSGWLAAVYEDLLERPIDPAGSAYWQGQLAGGLSRAAVAQAIGTSSEAHGRVVGDVFNQYLDRDPEPAALAWGRGLLDSGISQQLFTASVVGSQEYFDLADGEPDG